MRGRYGRPALQRRHRPAHPRRAPPGRRAHAGRGRSSPTTSALDTDDNQLLIITGPEHGGQDRPYMRQVALIVLMAQIGSFVPAEAAQIGLVDRIFTRIGAQDDIATGQSTFMVEMTETAALLMQTPPAQPDHPRRGGPRHQHLRRHGDRPRGGRVHPQRAAAGLPHALRHPLPRADRPGGTLPRVRNFHMAAVEQGDHVVFLHELRPAGPTAPTASTWPQLAGIPRSVIRRASELLAELEAGRKDEGRRMKDEEQEESALPAHPSSFIPHPSNQLSLFDLAPSPVVEYLRRLNINELTPLEAMNKLYELAAAAKGVGLCLARADSAAVAKRLPPSVLPHARIDLSSRPSAIKRGGPYG